MKTKDIPTMMDSLVLASRINIIKAILFGCQDEETRKSLMNQAEMFMRDFPPLETDVIQDAVQAMRDQANWQETAMIFNPGYNSQKTEVIADQANTLEYLGKFVDGLKNVTAMKNAATENEKALMDLRSKFL